MNVPGPCGAHGPYPANIIEGLPSDLPLAKALHGSGLAVANQLKPLIVEGNAIVDVFYKDNDIEELNRCYMEWQSKVEKVLSNLDSRLDDALTHVKSPQSGQSRNLTHDQVGIDLCGLIVVKMDVLILYENQLRGVGD